MSAPRTPSTRARRRWFMRWRERPPRDRGVALLVVITWLAMMIALVSQFTFGTSVEASQAANARDELRAHYMARSGVNLSRLLIKIQSKFVEPVMSQAQKMMQSMTGSDPSKGATGNTANMATGGLGISLRVTDYADLLMGFFSGSSEEVASLGSLIGLDIKEAKGLGMKNGRFDAEITAEDAKIDVNCGSGLVTTTQDKSKQLGVFRLLNGLMFSPRYDRLFSQQDKSGQFFSRIDVARALIDWADTDEQLFSPEGAGGAEDYAYDAQKDKYKAHDARYDSLEEIKQVRGVTDEFREAFGPYLTVYPNSDPEAVQTRRCRVNLGTVTNRMGGDCAPLIMGVIRAAAMGDPTKLSTVDPTILDDTKLYPIATILCDRASAGGFDSIETILRVAAKPEAAVMQDDPRYRVLSGMKPLVLARDALDAVAYVHPPRTYKIVATGQSGKVRKKITAILDTGRPNLDNPLSLNYASELAAGVIQYWREE